VDCYEYQWFWLHHGSSLQVYSLLPKNNVYFLITYYDRWTTIATCNLRKHGSDSPIILITDPLLFVLKHLYIFQSVGNGSSREWIHLIQPTGISFGNCFLQTARLYLILRDIVVVLLPYVVWLILFLLWNCYNTSIVWNNSRLVISIHKGASQRVVVMERIIQKLVIEWDHHWLLVSKVTIW
jgi:hypothetical protein